jgi:succinoglycan biosynthesis transport protein ExoP
MVMAVKVDSEFDENRSRATRRDGNRPVPQPGPLPGARASGFYSFSSLANLARRRWLIIGLVAAFTWVAISSLGFILPPRYTAEAFIRIDPSNKSVLDVSAAFGRPPDAAYVDTEVNEIVSRPVAEAVVRHLELQHADEFRRHPSLFRRVFGMVVAPTEVEQFDNAVDATLKNLQVSREQTSYRVAVRFSSQSPTRAALVANSFVEEYLNRSRSMQTESATGQVKVLNEQLQQLAESVRSADDELAKYRANTGLARSSSSATGTLNDQQIASIGAQVAVADAAAAEANSRADGAKRQASEKGAENVGEVLASPVITELRKKRAEVVHEQARILLTYGPLYPASVRISQQLSDLDKQIEQEAQRVISGLESTAGTAVATAKSLRGQLQALKNEQSRNLRASVQADSLERDAQAKRSTYERVAQAAQQIGQDVVVPAGRLSSLAVEPHQASFPNKRVFLAVGALLGLVLGLTAAFVADAMDKSVYESRFFPELIGVPFLGAVPNVSAKELRESSAQNACDYALQRPRSAYAESLRNLRVSFLTANPARTGQIICIASALPNEGKSTLALSLGRLMAISGDKVILIDGDKHRSSLRALLPQSGPVGLLEVLRDKSRLPQALMKDDSGLHMLLQTDAAVENSDQLGSSRMHALLSVLRSAYRFVIIDTPPVLAVADACSLAAASDKTLIVVKWGKTPRAAVQAAAKRLQEANVSITGGAFTQIDITAHAQLDDSSPFYYYSLVKDYYGG